jgi:hypothetical protein
MRHIVWLGVNTLNRMVKEDDARMVMYTLTYKGAGDWEPRHISGFCRWLKAKGSTGYVWVAELQRRGAVHYHILSLLPNGQKWIKPSEDSGGWSRGFTWVTDGIEKPFYIMKYLQKGSKDGRFAKFPKGLRLYGVANRVARRMCFEDASAYRRSALPGWFRDGTNDLIVVRSSYRANGGVSVGGLLAISPYDSSHIHAIDEVGGMMYSALNISWQACQE